MKKKYISIPENILYLGNYQDLMFQLPEGSFIFNKVMTGCGATTMFLNDSVPTILCSPRREMIRCKAESDDFSGKVHLFGSESPKGTVLDKIKDLENYIQRTLYSPFNQGVTSSCKILVTYDSAKHVWQGLLEMKCLQYFRVVVDEFQTLFTDAAFRGDTEIEFMENITKTGNTTIYLSATPYLEGFLNVLPAFSNLPYVELVWPDSSKHHINIHSQPYIDGSRSKTIKAIIDRYRQNGFFEEAMDENNVIHQATEAVFFINDPSFIVSTIKKNGLSSNEVNVICAENPNNEQLLSKAGLVIGHAPKRGIPNATFTFVTKCSFEGTDFYSSNAFTYIFSDIRPGLENMAMDISIDIPQIIGRQRMPTNFFRYSARLYCKFIPVFDAVSKTAYMDRIQDKVDESNIMFTNLDITDTRALNAIARKFRNSQKVEKYKNDYIAVVDDKQSNQQKFVFNWYVMLNEIRSWFIHNELFPNRNYVYNTILETFACSKSENSKLVSNFLLGFKGTFEECMKMYSEFLDLHPECKPELQQSFQVSMSYKEYYNRMGPSALRSLSWKEANIKPYMAQPYIPCTDFGEVVRQTFSKGWYSLKSIKEKLQELYDKYKPGHKAYGSDIEQFCDCKKAKKTMPDGTRDNGYEIM